MWYIGGKKKRNQKGKGFLIGVIASLAAPVLGAVAQNQLLRKYLVEEKDPAEKLKDGKKNNNFKKKSKSKGSKSTKWQIFY